MNIQKFTLLILFSNISCSVISMELPPAVDHKKIQEDQRMMSNGLELIMQDYGKKEFSVASTEARASFINKFLAHWTYRSFSGHLTYTFDSYMMRAEIDANWMEELHKQTIKKDAMMVNEFLPLLMARFNTTLAKYNPTEIK
ncbi:hypothetical protein BH09DEP1_BH09DEP1_5010 [soil metagenome]